MFRRTFFLSASVLFAQSALAADIFKAAAKPEAPKKKIILSTTPWYVDGKNTPDEHLIKDHGYDPTDLTGLTAHQKNLLHGTAHGYTTSNCPGGVCPLPSRRSKKR